MNSAEHNWTGPAMHHRHHWRFRNVLLGDALRRMPALPGGAHGMRSSASPVVVLHAFIDFAGLADIQ